MANALAVQVQDLHLSFGENRAVDGVSFDVVRGEIFGLLGPNGAGKTTLISMLSCLLTPDSGNAAVMGHSILTEAQKVKASIGVVPQEVALYGDLSARENLVFWGKMQDLRGTQLARRVDEVLEIIGLSDRQKDRVSTYSGGMKRRVNIAVALLHKPELVIMDEPTVGIDPQSRRSILDNVKLLRDQGMTILYTTHYMEEAQELSDRVGIMDHGKLVAVGTKQELVTTVGEVDRIDLRLTGPYEALLATWKATADIHEVTVQDGVVTVLAADGNRALPRLFESAATAGVRIASINVQEPNLEAVFLQLTGRALRD